MYDFDTFLALAILQRNVSATQARATFFFIRDDCAGTKMSFPRWRCRESQFCCSRPRCRSHFFVVPALVAVHNFGFFNPSNGILLVLLEITLSVMFGDLEFRKWQIRRVYFARGVQKMITDFDRFKN